jgi:Domain of unknown function (DUF1858)
MSIPITPETRIAELLEAYPDLEKVLLQQSPHFRHLKNPLLRKTVAKVATIEKAAQMSGIPLRQLVAVLRDAAGLPGEPGAADLSQTAEAAGLDAMPPDWFDPATVARTIDADALLDSGQVPISHVHQAVQDLPPGVLLRVKSAFRPTPLLEALHKAGHRTYVTRVSPEAFHTFVARRES